MREVVHGALRRRQRHGLALSRQLVLFCIERRKAWRQLQSRAGVVNRDYQAQRALLKQLDAGKLTRADLWARGTPVDCVAQYSRRTA